MSLRDVVMVPWNTPLMLGFVRPINGGKRTIHPVAYPKQSLSPKWVLHDLFPLTDMTMTEFTCLQGKQMRLLGMRLQALEFWPLWGRREQELCLPAPILGLPVCKHSPKFTTRYRDAQRLTRTCQGHNAAPEEHLSALMSCSTCPPRDASDSCAALVLSGSATVG